MKLAILADIHGNQHALNEVINELQRENIIDLLLLGDYVGYYYHPEVVLQKLFQYQIRAVVGNHERLLFDFEDDPVKHSSVLEKYGTGHQAAVRNLSEDQKKWLHNLPETLELEIDGLKILLCHGAPWSNDHYIYADSDESTLAEFDRYKVDFIFLGHSHYAYCIKRNNCSIVNPGSVGQSRQRGGYAFWAIFDTKSRVIDFRTTPYDVSELKKEISMNDPHLGYNLRILDRR